jgi:hypothetical protein
MPPVFLKEPFLDMASKVWAMPEEQWIDDRPILRDTELLEREAKGDSKIDELNLREDMIQKWKAGQVKLRVRELPGRTRVVCLSTQKQWDQIPWALWARIFQAIGHPVGYILFYAHPQIRDYPGAPGATVEAENINAGYSYLCQQSVVVIYRFEEATRVLLHELLHTACFDKEKETVLLEAHTEAWTELFLCALLSKGGQGKFNKLWKQQCAWMQAQTNHLEKRYNVTGPNDYSWRYMTGKQKVLESMDWMADCKPRKGGVGLRFTTPEWDQEMRK